MVIDSTVLVDVIRGKEDAHNFLSTAKESLTISRAGEIEMVRGAKTRKDVLSVLKLIKNLNIKVIEISEEISKLAGDFFESYYHKYGLGAMDSFIAATAVARKERLASHNIKHFKFIKDLELIIPY